MDVNICTKRKSLSCNTLNFRINKHADYKHGESKGNTNFNYI